MRIKKLKLYTNKLEEEYSFYSSTLGFDVIDKTRENFTLRVGWSELCFERRRQTHSYHYCFLIPCNMLPSALEWMEQRTEIINIEDCRKVQHFESWNADSFYFYDASDNLVEFIVRHDLGFSEPSSFDLTQIICVNEIGIPVTDIMKMNQQLEQELSTMFWKGNLERFGTNGDQEGLILLPNYNIKETWFPTSLPIKPYPLEATIDNEGELFDFVFDAFGNSDKDFELKISAKTKRS